MTLDKRQFAQALNRKDVTEKCPMCKNKGWTDIPNYTWLQLSDDPNGPDPTGPVIAVVGLTCTNCGFLSLHVARTLGLA